MQAKVAEATATSSDHWPLSLGLLPRRTTRGEQPKGQKSPFKPIGWQLKELTFNDEIRERAGMEMPVTVAEILQNAYHVYTDGSYTGLRHLAERSAKHKRDKTLRPEIAGWGAAFFEEGPPPSEAYDAARCFFGIIFTGTNFEGALKGRVTALREAAVGTKVYVGAMRKTNNTAGHTSRRGSLALPFGTT